MSARISVVVGWVIVLLSPLAGVEHDAASIAHATPLDELQGGIAPAEAACRYVHTCGNGIIEPPAEECDGQTGCGPGCTLARQVCCDVDDALCIGGTVYDEESVRNPWRSGCSEIPYGAFSHGVCDGPPCSPSGDADCRVGSCADRAIDPLPVCCQQHEGGCRDAILTSSKDFGEFGCGARPDVFGEWIVVGTCGRDGACLPAN